MKFADCSSAYFKISLEASAEWVAEYCLVHNLLCSMNLHFSCRWTSHPTACRACKDVLLHFFARWPPNTCMTNGWAFEADGFFICVMWGAMHAKKSVKPNSPTKLMPLSNQARKFKPKINPGVHAGPGISTCKPIRTCKSTRPMN